MKQIKYVLISAILSSISLAALAETNPISVHVLSLQNGLPSPGVEVKLEKKNGDNWELLNKSKTDENGRITALYPQGKKMDRESIYKVTFETGKWFAQNKTKTFFPEIPVIFKADGNLDHYHIPLLLSPYGFSTYRGN